ncbi:MAG: nucleotidyl transferase AbiEii/AbiGii toxin family protein [Bradymonadaceae bacterium]
MNTPLFDTLNEVAGLLDERGVEWVLVGGLAISVYVEPRFTRDIAIAISVSDDDEAERFVREWQSAGFAVPTVVEQDAVGRLATARSHRPGDEHGVVVDLLFASSGIEPEIVDESRKVTIVPNLTVPVARPGHLFALKVLAADEEQRPQDEADLANLREILDAEEERVARRAVECIVERGFARGRNLSARLEERLAG